MIARLQDPILFYLIQFGIVWGLSGTFLIALVYLITLPFSGKFAIGYSERFKKWWARLRYNRLLSAKNPKLLQLIEMRKSLKEMVKDVLKSASAVVKSA